MGTWKEEYEKDMKWRNNSIIVILIVSIVLGVMVYAVAKYFGS